VPRRARGSFRATSLRPRPFLWRCMTGLCSRSNQKTCKGRAQVAVSDLSGMHGPSMLRDVIDLQVILHHVSSATGKLVVDTMRRWSMTATGGCKGNMNTSTIWCPLHYYIFCLPYSRQRHTRRSNMHLFFTKRWQVLPRQHRKICRLNDRSKRPLWQR
jgi:hypothetical protein